MRTAMQEFREALDHAEPRPTILDSASTKKNYAERLSRATALLVANGLRTVFPGITPDAGGTRQENPSMAARKFKKLDVNYSTQQQGLALTVSIKTLNFRDPKNMRYTKNYTRIDNELRAEAMDYHPRHPYAVFVGVLFLPADSCDDSKVADSSFACAVDLFRHRANRRTPRDEYELFERIFVAIYEHEGPTRGEVGFFDVTNDPPRNGRPTSPPLFDFTGFLGEIVRTYRERNPARR